MTSTKTLNLSTGLKTAFIGVNEGGLRVVTKDRLCVKGRSEEGGDGCEKK